MTESSVREITYEDYIPIAKELEKCSAIFQVFWELGRPSFSKEIETAAVVFDNEGNFLSYLFNPDYYESLTFVQRAFVVAHECLHIILNHGIRIRDCENVEICNIAADIVVNHLIIENFGMNRYEIDPENKYCWADTVFPGQNVRTDECMEYYINLMLYGKGFSPKDIVDDHSGLAGMPSESLVAEAGTHLSEQEKQDVCNKLGESVERDKSNASNGLEAGTGAGDISKWMSKKKVIKKKKWETIIKKWEAQFLKRETKNQEQWLRVSRRIANLSQDVILPCEMEMDDFVETKNKIDVCFFIDTSGSCSHLADRFWKAARSLDERKFNINLFCFDTEVYDVSFKEGKLYGFGGTYFHILENAIQDRIKKGVFKKYPSAMFVITDGYGNRIHPKYPKKWHWFLTACNSTSCIPKESKIYKLSEFE